MCGILGIVARSPVNQLLYDGLLLLQHRGQDAAGMVTSEQRHPAHAQGQRHGARRVPHAQHARPRRQLRHRPLPLSDRRLGVQGRRGAAVLRQLAVRHRPRPQRQPDQLRSAEGGDVPHRPAAHQHRLGLRGAGQRAGARAGEVVEQAQARAAHHLHRGRQRAPAPARRLRRGGDDRRLRRAGVPRSLRHPAGGDRLQRDQYRHRVHGRLRVGRARRARLSPAARHRARRGGVHRRRGQLPQPAVRRAVRASIPASSNTSTWRGPTR